MPQLYLLVSLLGTQHSVGLVSLAFHTSHLQGQPGLAGVPPLPTLPQGKRPPCWMASEGWDDGRTMGKRGAPAELTAELFVFVSVLLW